MSFHVPKAGTTACSPSTDAACRAHDQNNLLQAAFCMVHALEPHLLADTFALQKLEALHRALDGIARMNESVLNGFRNARSGMSDPAAWDAGDLDVSSPALPMNPDEVIERAVALARIVAAKSIRIEPRLGAKGAILSIPEIYLQQVVYNLIKNGVEAAPEGGRVVVESSILLRGGWDTTNSKRPGLRVTVTDNGPGIPKEIGARLFECGFTSKPEGHGLGLYHARKILRLYGGSITMDNCHPCGTRVTILWPSEKT